MPDYCRHYECQLDAADETFFLSRLLRRPELFTQAQNIVILNKEVRCRHVPRRGGANAPFPGEQHA